jgi:phosphoribosylaminoimidazolecarboxamide formyltransferase/IMP cyclohydrolase
MDAKKRAVLSVSDKRGIAELAENLVALGYEIISTGGTAALLAEKGIPVTRISDLTGFPEMMEGRIKTLHPKLLGGILALRDKASHVEAMEKHGIPPVDLVVVNLYPFAETVKKPDVTLAEAIENIDIGGPTMIRAAAKNYEHVAVVTDPDDYALVIEQLKEKGAVDRGLRGRLAQKVFSTMARYNGMIAAYLEKTFGEVVPAEDTPEALSLKLEKIQSLRYGENPHQKAAFYREIPPVSTGIPEARQLQGKALSFNNIVDFEAAWTASHDFDEPAAVVIKHTNPCGAAIAPSPAEAFKRARETDPVSAFGSVIGFNREVDGDAAREIVTLFVEGIVAPGFTPEAREILSKKKKVRILALDPPDYGTGGYDMKKVMGGLLLQDRDISDLDPAQMDIKTRRSPTEEEMKALRFAWKVVKLVKSNAIVFTSATQTIGVGAGQMSRVDAVKIAVMKAQLPLEGSVVASDAFFPFRDGLDAAADAGATAVIQPGGSIRDKEVIEAADERGLAMVFTGIRHFRH